MQASLITSLISRGVGWLMAIDYWLLAVGKVIGPSFHFKSQQPTANSQQPIAALFLALVLCALAGCESGKTTVSTDKPAADNVLERTAQKGPVKMTLRISPKEPRLSDLMSLDVIVQADAGVEVIPPTFGQAVGDFLVRDYSEKTAAVNSDTTKSDKVKKENAPPARDFHYQLEPTHAGKHLIRSIVVEFSDKRQGTESKGEPTRLESDPIEINITSELGDKTPSLTDLTPMQAPVSLPPRPIWFRLLIGFAVIGAVAAVVFLRKRLSTRKALVVIKRTPEEIARDELNALLAMNLHGTGQFKEFYVRLTGIVRRYIEGTTGIHAPEQTTEEFLRDMRVNSKAFPPERSERLAQFLEAADMVKYAAMQPGLRQIEESIARAQEFVGLPSAFRPMPVEV